MHNYILKFDILQNNKESTVNLTEMLMIVDNRPGSKVKVTKHFQDLLVWKTSQESLLVIPSFTILQMFFLLFIL